MYTMQKKTQSIPVQILITLGGVGVGILNLWAVGKLSPIYKDIATIVTRVEAVERRYVSSDEFVPLKEQVNRIEDKVDALVSRAK